MTNDLPHFLIIGAQKTGSTYVHGLLRAHPDIYMPAQEVRFFEDPEYGDGDLAPLTELFHRRPEPLRGIKRPDYLARPEVPARIHRHIPNARLIAILRNPVERLISAYYYYIKLGFIPVLHINDGLRRILKGDDLGSRRSAELLEYGRYAAHLERYFQLFPREQILVLLQEDIARKTEEAARRIYAFLGVRSDIPLPQVERDNSGLYSTTRLRLLTQRNRFLYDYDQAGKIVQRDGWARITAAAAITAADRYVLAPLLGNPKPSVDTALLDELSRVYRDDIQRLEELLGRSLEHWKRAS